MEETKKKFTNKFLFDYLRNIISSKSEETMEFHFSQPDFASFPRYMVFRYLTMSTDEDTRNIILDNSFALERMDNRVFYRWCLENVPKSGNSFIRYIK